MFTFFISAIVPLICDIRGTELFCNAPYSLYIESSDGRRLIEESGPNVRTLPALPEGERYVVVAG